MPTKETGTITAIVNLKCTREEKRMESDENKNYEIDHVEAPYSADLGPAEISENEADILYDGF